MARSAGIPLVDLFELTDRINAALPPAFQRFSEPFVLTQHRATRSAGAIHHHGVLQSVFDSVSVDTEELDIGIGTLQIPLIHAGVPVQFAIARSEIVNNLEPGPASWQMDIRLADFILTLDALEPAIYVPEIGTTPRHLVRDPERDRVKIIGSATVVSALSRAIRRIVFRLSLNGGTKALARNTAQSLDNTHWALVLCWVLCRTPRSASL